MAAEIVNRNVRHEIPVLCSSSGGMSTMFFDMLLQMGIMFEASSTIDANKGSFPSMDTNMRLEFGQSWKGLEAVGTVAVARTFF